MSVLGKLFTPRAPQPLPEDAQVRWHFGPDRGPDGKAIQYRPQGAPGLAAAVARVKAEITDLRSQIAAAGGSRSDRQLRRLIDQCKTALQEAGKKLERTQRQVRGGAAELSDATAAKAAWDSAYAHLSACNAELSLRLKADDASERLRSLLAELA